MEFRLAGGMPYWSAQLRGGVFPPGLAYVHQVIGHRADGHSRWNIQKGVLLQEDRRDRNEDRLNGKRHAPPNGGKAGSVPRSGQDRQRANDMERRTNIGIGVKLVEPGHEASHEIVTGKDCGA